MCGCVRLSVHRQQTLQTCEERRQGGLNGRQYLSILSLLCVYMLGHATD